MKIITIIGCCVSGLIKSAEITEYWTPSNHRDTFFSIYLVFIPLIIPANFVLDMPSRSSPSDVQKPQCNNIPNDKKTQNKNQTKITLSVY